MGQYMKLRQSDGPGLDVIDAQNRGYVGSGQGEGCAFSREMSTKLRIYPGQCFDVGSSRMMIV